MAAIRALEPQTWRAYARAPREHIPDARLVCRIMTDCVRAKVSTVKRRTPLSPEQTPQRLLAALARV